MTSGSPADHLEQSGPAGAPVVVVVHGCMDRAETFARLARRLRDDTRVVRYDRRGYGRHVELEGPFTLGAHVADLVAVLDRVGPAVVVGHSLGGLVALVAGARHPERVRAVVAYEAPMLWAPWWPAEQAGGWALTHAARGSADVAEGFMRRAIGDGAWERLPAPVRDLRRREGVALLAELADAARADPLPPGPLAVPVVVAHGGSSDAAHHRAAHEQAVAREAPLVRVEEAHHGVHLSHPDELAAVVRLAQGLAEAAP